MDDKKLIRSLDTLLENDELFTNREVLSIITQYLDNIKVYEKALLCKKIFLSDVDNIKQHIEKCLLNYPQTVDNNNDEIEDIIHPYLYEYLKTLWIPTKNINDIGKNIFEKKKKEWEEEEESLLTQIKSQGVFKSVESIRYMYDNILSIYFNSNTTDIEKKEKIENFVGSEISIKNINTGDLKIIYDNLPIYVTSIKINNEISFEILEQFIEYKLPKNIKTISIVGENRTLSIDILKLFKNDFEKIISLTIEFSINDKEELDEFNICLNKLVNIKYLKLDIDTDEYIVNLKDIRFPVDIEKLTLINFDDILDIKLDKLKSLTITNLKSIVKSKIISLPKNLKYLDITNYEFEKNVIEHCTKLETFLFYSCFFPEKKLPDSISFLGITNSYDLNQIIIPDKTEILDIQSIDFDEVLDLPKNIIYIHIRDIDITNRLVYIHIKSKTYTENNYNITEIKEYELIKMTKTYKYTQTYIKKREIEDTKENIETLYDNIYKLKNLNLEKYDIEVLNLGKKLLNILNNTEQKYFLNEDRARELKILYNIVNNKEIKTKLDEIIEELKIKDIIEKVEISHIYNKIKMINKMLLRKDKTEKQNEKIQNLILDVVTDFKLYIDEISKGNISKFFKNNNDIYVYDEDLFDKINNINKFIFDVKLDVKYKELIEYLGKFVYIRGIQEPETDNSDTEIIDDGFD